MAPRWDPYRIELQTARLRLRVLRPADRAEFTRVHACSAEHFRPWFPASPPGETPDTRFERELTAAERGARNDDACRLVGELEDGRLAGFFNLSQIWRGPFQNAYASWSVSADCTGRGLATEGVRALLIDKDKTPRWSYPDVASVPSSAVDDFLAPLWSPAEHPLRDL